MPQSTDVLSTMLSMGATHSCEKAKETSVHECALIKLVELPDADTLVPLFYAARPKVNDEHLRACLQNVVQMGNLGLLLTILELPHDSTAEKVVAALLEKSVVADLLKLLELGHTDMAEFLAAGNLNYLLSKETLMESDAIVVPRDLVNQFSPDIVVSAFHKTCMNVAKSVILGWKSIDFSARIHEGEKIICRKEIPPLETLELYDSNHIWSQINCQDVEVVSRLLNIGVGPTPYAVVVSSGLIAHNQPAVSSFIDLRSWNYLEEFKSTVLNPYAFEILDVFLANGLIIDQRFITTVVATGHKPYIKHILDCWKLQNNYVDRCIIGPNAVNNAFMSRDWDLVELLLNACQEWSAASARSGSNLSDETIIGVVDMDMIETDLAFEGGYEFPTPYPMDVNDFYYFENVPYLIKIGVYSESHFNSALSQMAFIAVDWDLQKFEDTVNKLMSFGAIVTPKALYNATYQEGFFCGATPRFRFLLGKYEPDSSPEFVHWDDILTSIHHSYGDVEVLHLLLERGVAVTKQTLLTALKNCVFKPMQPGVEELFKAVKPGDPLLHGLFDDIVENPFFYDLHGDNFYSVFEMMWEVGFRTTETAVERAIGANKPNLARLMKRLVEKIEI
ncbi:hypothetical protein HDU79_011786 [Rhizoclosmatium sp. JEL0117]|nr:hypothetical protein HDU79_011786 [Rhizoclosmatium sp. JEL0117]